MKILVVIITKDYVEDECIKSVVSQDYKDKSWMIYGQDPIENDPHYIVNLYKNCSATRSKARKLALASDADAFLFMDSDIVLPTNALSNFVLQASNQFGANRIFGGWYEIRNDPDKRFTCGRWVADNVYSSYREEILPSLVVTDMVGLGCAFIPRNILQEVDFEHGCDFVYNDEKGKVCIGGECLALGNRVCEKGYKMYMNGDVICNHLPSRRKI